MWRPRIIPVLLLCAGCAATRPLASHPAPSSLPSAAELQAALAARRAALHSLRGIAHLRYRSPEESSSSREAIIVARPDRLRVEVLSMFGSLFVLTAEHGTMMAYARQEDTVYQGQASSENLWRYARLALPVSDIVDIVLGTPPLRQVRRARVSFDDRSGWVRLDQESDDAAQIVWFNELQMPTAAEERGSDGRPCWRARFDDYESNAGLSVATRIRLESPAVSRTMEIALGDVDVNPPLERSAFTFPIPPGSKVVDLDAAHLDRRDLIDGVME